MPATRKKQSAPVKVSENLPKHPKGEGTPPDDIAPPDDERTRRVFAVMKARDDEAAAVEARGYKAVDLNGSRARELVSYIDVVGIASVSKIAAELDVKVSVAEHYITALERVGRVRRQSRQHRDGTDFVETTAPPE